MLDFRMNTFIAVCQCLSYTKAAEQLHITQPAVSQHIHYLEQSYGVTLFQMQGRKIQLTAAGELLLQAATTIRHDDAYLRERLRTAAGEKKKMTFGVTFTIGEFVIAGAIAKFISQNVDISLKIVTANTRELLAKLQNGEIDFAIMEGNFDKREVEALIYSRERFIGVCGPDMEVKNEAVTMEELLSQRLLIREEGSGTREVFVKDLERRNLTAEDFAGVIEIGNMSAIKELVKKNTGIAFLYEAAVKEELAMGTICKIPITDFDVSHDFSFIWNKGSIYKERYQRLFYELGGTLAGQ